MPTLLLIFYLIAKPSPRLICTLWLSQPATSADVAAACGPISLDQYQVWFRSLRTGQVVCQQNASAIYAPDEACHLAGTLDQFTMEIMQPAQNEQLICSVTSPNNPPSPDEIRAQCGDQAALNAQAGLYEVRYIGPLEQTISAPPASLIPYPLAGSGLYDQPSSADELTSHQALTWLAGRLIWFGLVTPDCDGGTSGLDPLTLAANACGMEAARPLVDEWQNRFDADIYAAAVAEGVPARLLKRVLMQESQFWPLWGQRPADEIGIAQVTPAAADAYLRIYGPNDYGFQSNSQQNALQEQFMASLRCDACDLSAALDKERQNIMIYARLLRAYRAGADDWYGALVRWDGESYASKVESGG